jgi:hypothetical protein
MRAANYPSIEAAIEAIADELLRLYAPEQLAVAAATMILKLTCHYSVSPEDGSVTVRGTLLDDPDINL